MITLVETFKPTLGEPVITTKKFPTRQAFKKSLRASPISTHLAYELLVNGHATIEFKDGTVTMQVDEFPKLEIVK